MINNLKQLREDKNMRQYDLAQKAGISRSYYTMIENGKKKPSPKVAKRIAKILNFDWTIFYA
ncbi:helix-turn-helix transcriptional regulator [Acidaminococcus sp. HCP3S3_G9_1]|uniref:helix-turn-helix transcriptional regulator n=1 Tax=Acidaminococcus sp. HCP3S3_G9_1 TaxID=3438732 RepID=UPI003F933B8C